MRELSFPSNFINRLPLWLQGPLHDRYLWAMLIIALFVNLGLFAFLLLVQNQLPLLVPLHFDSAGQPDRIEGREAIFSLPQIGLIMILGNILVGALFYRREPLTTYLLAGVAIVVQFLLWLAAISIVRVVVV
jgi:Domain of unknown function (DUF1648)